MRLHTFFRNQAGYRVRIALRLKGVDFDYISVDLQRDGGQHLRPDYLAMNPQGLIPSLELDGAWLTQSLAILEFLEETHPAPPLLPKDAVSRALVRSFVLHLASDVTPLNNLRVHRFLKSELDVSRSDREHWYRHWTLLGLRAANAQLGGEDHDLPFCYGDTPGLADVCLIPFVENASRLGVDTKVFPTIVRIADHCSTLSAFLEAAPDRQPDARE